MTTLAAPYMMKNSPIQKAYGNALGVKTGFSGITSSPFKILPIFAVIGAALKAGGAAIGGAIAKGGIAIAKGAMTVGAKLGIKGAAAAATKLGAAAGKVSAWSAGAAKGLGTALGKAGMGSKLYAGIHAKALAAAKGAGGVTTAAGKAAFGKSMAVGLKGFTGTGVSPMTGPIIAYSAALNYPEAINIADIENGVIQPKADIRSICNYDDLTKWKN